jgi:MerR family mercuric resistance operon transcriptional regulator
MASGPFTVAQLARIVGMSIGQVRRYQELGLLQAPRRRRGRSADVSFHAEHVQRLRFIKRALSVGYALEDIAKLVDPYSLGTCRDVYETTMRSMQRAMEHEPRRAKALAQLAEICPRVGSRGDCPIIASLTQEFD